VLRNIDKNNLLHTGPETGRTRRHQQ